MTVERSKRRFLIPIVFITNRYFCFLFFFSPIRREERKKLEIPDHWEVYTSRGIFHSLAQNFRHPLNSLSNFSPLLHFLKAHDKIFAEKKKKTLASGYAE